MRANYDKAAAYLKKAGIPFNLRERFLVKVGNEYEVDEQEVRVAVARIQDLNTRTAALRRAYAEARGTPRAMGIAEELNAVQRVLRGIGPTKRKL